MNIEYTNKLNLEVIKKSIDNLLNEGVNKSTIINEILSYIRDSKFHK